MTVSGFENVVEVRYKWPQNGWLKDKHHKTLAVQYSQYLKWFAWILRKVMYSGPRDANSGI